MEWRIARGDDADVVPQRTLLLGEVAYERHHAPRAHIWQVVRDDVHDAKGALAHPWWSVRAGWRHARAKVLAIASKFNPQQTALPGISLESREPHALRASHVVRELVLEQLSTAFAGVGIRAALVKGAALARTVYEPGWTRDMADLDVLVESRHLLTAVRAARGLGWTETERGSERPLSEPSFHEVELIAHVGPASVAIELHDALDKVVPRPVDYRGILDRARPDPMLPALGLPTTEDQLLLVALHLAVAEFRHPVGLLDLEQLIRSGIDWPIVEARAGQWKLRHALYACLVLLQVVGSKRVPSDVLTRLQPGRAQQRWIARTYDLDEYPPTRTPYQLGWTWLSRQLPLRDDPLRWLRSSCRYAGLRLMERGLKRLRRRR